MKRFRGGLLFKAHSLLYHSSPGSRVITKKKKTAGGGGSFWERHMRRVRPLKTALHAVPRGLEIRNPQPSAPNSQPSAFNPQPSNLNLQTSTLNLQPSTLNPKSAAATATTATAAAGCANVREWRAVSAGSGPPHDVRLFSSFRFRVFSDFARFQCVGQHILLGVQVAVLALVVRQ